MRYIIYCFLLMILFSCKFNANIQGKGLDELQGLWTEDRAAYQDQLLAYTLHHFKFSCDSFYLTFDHYARVNRYADHCFNDGHWQEFVKGTYQQKKDTLLLVGTFTKSNFKQKISGCYRIGQYNHGFLIQKQSPDSLLLQDVGQHLPMLLHLKTKLHCTPGLIN